MGRVYLTPYVRKGVGMNTRLVKGLLAIVGLVLMNAQSASAWWMAGSAWASPNLVQGQVCNTSYSSAIACSVTAQGVAISLADGTVQVPIFAYSNVVLAPGQCGLALVYATGPWAIQPWGAQAWGVCQFAAGTGW